MRLGLQVPNFTWPNGQENLGDTFSLIAQRAERAGFYSMWVMDHFFQIRNVGPAENEMLEGYTALSFAAGHTNRIKLGTMVTGVTYRHPPLLIGGSGERKTLRLVAQYGDGCNLFARLGNDELKHKLDVLRDHCQSIGRPYEEIEKTTLNSILLSRDGRNGSMTPAAAIEHFASLAAMGIDQAIFSMPNVYDLEPFDLLATEIIPAVEKTQVAGR